MKRSIMQIILTLTEPLIFLDQFSYVVLSKYVCYNIFDGFYLIIAYDFRIYKINSTK